MSTTKQRRRWLDRAVQAILAGGELMTTAQVRERLDEQVERAGAPEEAALEFAQKLTRTRTQLVRRSLRRLSKRGLLCSDKGPGVIGDHVERFWAPGGGREGQEDLRKQVQDLRLQLAQAELRHAGRMRTLRRYLACLCGHTKLDQGCLACAAFLVAGGQFETRMRDAEALSVELLEEHREAKL